MLTAIPPRSRQITKVERKDNALFLRSEYGLIRLVPKSENIVRITYTVNEAFSEEEKPGVVAKDPFADWTYSETEKEVKLALPKAAAVISKDSGAISFKDGNGDLLFSGDKELPVEFEEFETFILADAPQKTRTIETADGKKEILEDPLKLSTGKSEHIRFRFALDDEALYGLGQQEKGFASLRGRRVYVHQGNRKIAIPMFVSTKGYGLFVDAYSPMIFNDNEKGTYIYIEAAKELDYYLIAGEMNDAVRGYRFLTGKAALLPKWAFGYVQSQERYETQEEILETAKRSRKLGIGMDCIVLDWISWKDGEWGQKSYDPKRFPAPKEMIDSLHRDHVHFMISLWPTMAENTENHKEFAQRHLFLPGCSAYDAFKKEARELYFDQLKRTHFSYGTDAWWCDSSEPFTPEWNHRVRPEEDNLFREYLNEAGLRMPYEYCNAYSYYHALGIYENQRKAMEEEKYPEKRVCNLTRSAYTGQQRLGTVMWSGDTDASWDTLRDQVAIGLHFAASGMPFWTMDIGAFFVKRGEFWYWDGKYDKTAEDPEYCELYTRWYQFGAFLPIFRAHGTDVRRELWTFKGEFYDALLKANRLRYSLMPYIYSEAGKVWLKDNSLIRWLAFDFASDKNTWEIKDQFLFGEDMMVCPVLAPMYYGGTKDIAKGEREVYFPEGCDWYDYYTKKKYKGGSRAAVSAKLDEIPLFVKEGSLIPVAKPALSTEEQTEAIEWISFGDGTCSYELYEDAGDGYGYERGEYTLRKISDK